MSYKQLKPEQVQTKNIKGSGFHPLCIKSKRSGASILSSPKVRAYYAKLKGEEREC